MTSRLTDRPIRPLFPKSFRNETQVIITVLQSDGENISDTWAGVGASAALLVSNIPWNGPIATVRVGMIGTDFIFNPTREQLDDCAFEMVVSGNKENIVMVEGEANEVKEEVIVDALKFAQDHILNIIQVQEELAEVYTILSTNPTVSVVVEGHADETGSEGYNQRLSEKRANAAAEYLIQLGVSADRLSTKGYGEAAPLSDNNTSEGRAANRRVEFKVQ